LTDAGLRKIADFIVGELISLVCAQIDQLNRCCVDKEVGQIDKQDRYENDHADHLRPKNIFLVQILKSLYKYAQLLERDQDVQDQVVEVADVCDGLADCVHVPQCEVCVGKGQVSSDNRERIE
jgi:hypothetical protein